MTIYGFVDSFFIKLFKASRLISALIVTICLIVIILTGIGLLFSGPKSLDVPDFSTIRSAIEEEEVPQISKTEDYAVLEKRRDVEKQFGDRVNKAIRNYNLSAEAYNILISDLLEMDKKYRRKYIRGFTRFLGGAENFLKEQKEDDEFYFSIPDAANSYREMYSDAISEVEFSKIDAAENKMYLLAVLGFSLLLLLAFLVIPLLLQIENNTRKLQQ